LDTHVISEIRKGDRANPGVRRWMADAQKDDAFLSALTIGEIRRGIELKRRRDEVGARHLDVWLQGLLVNFKARILPVDDRVADLWGRLNVPDPFGTIDGLIAATALVHGLTVVTRNEADLARTGARIFNPFL
jgi:predicted nucleic acid-binding protein